MRTVLLASLLAIAVTVLLACTNPNPNTPEIVAYNNSIIQMWLTVAGVVGSIVAAATAYMAKKQSGEVSTKLDVQQEELLQKSDRQTHTIVQNTAAAVEQAASMVPPDDGKRNRRVTDNPLGG